MPKSATTVSDRPESSVTEHDEHHQVQRNVPNSAVDSGVNRSAPQQIFPELALLIECSKFETKLFETDGYPPLCNNCGDVNTEPTTVVICQSSCENAGLRHAGKLVECKTPSDYSTINSKFVVVALTVRCAVPLSLLNPFRSTQRFEFCSVCQPDCLADARIGQENYISQLFW